MFFFLVPSSDFIILLRLTGFQNQLHLANNTISNQKGSLVSLKDTIGDHKESIKEHKNKLREMQKNVLDHRNFDLIKKIHF